MKPNINKSTVDILMNEKYYHHDTYDAGMFSVKMREKNHRVIVPLSDINHEQKNALQSLGAIKGIHVSFDQDHLVIKTNDASNDFGFHMEDRGLIIKSLLLKALSGYELNKESQDALHSRKETLQIKAQNMQAQAVEVRNQIGPLKKVSNMAACVAMAPLHLMTSKGLTYGFAGGFLAMGALLSSAPAAMAGGLIGASLGFYYGIMIPAWNHFERYQNAKDFKIELSKINRDDELQCLMEAVLNETNPSGARPEFNALLRGGNFNDDQNNSLLKRVDKEFKHLIKQDDPHHSMDEASANLLKIKEKILNTTDNDTKIQPKSFKV